MRSLVSRIINQSPEVLKSNISPGLSESIKQLVDDYKNPTVKSGNYIISVYRNVRFGTIEIRDVEWTSFEGKLKYSEELPDMVMIHSRNHQCFYAAKDGDTQEPYNEPPGLFYAPYSLGALKKAAKLGGIRLYYSRPKEKHQNVKINGFRYLPHEKAVRFDVCISRKKKDRFLNDLLSLLGYETATEIPETIEEKDND